MSKETLVGHSDHHFVTHDKHGLWINDMSDGHTYVVRIVSNQTRRATTLGEFRSSVRTHDFETACRVFKRLAHTKAKVYKSVNAMKRVLAIKLEIQDMTTEEKQ